VTLKKVLETIFEEGVIEILIRGECEESKYPGGKKFARFILELSGAGSRFGNASLDPLLSKNLELMT